MFPMAEPGVAAANIKGGTVGIIKGGKGATRWKNRRVLKDDAHLIPFSGSATGGTRASHGKN